jgi:thiamine biosynthesis lipoprotein
MGTTIMLTPGSARVVSVPDDRGLGHEVMTDAMGGGHVVVVGDPDDGWNGAHLAYLGELAIMRLADLDRRWNRSRSDSEVNRINASAGRPVLVSPATFALVERAIEAWRWTDGCFDPTVRPARRRPWRPGVRPLDDDVTGHLATGVERIQLASSMGAVVLPAAATLDVSGLARGFAADLVASELLAAGAAGVLVNVGGDVRVTGRWPATAAWAIAVEDPQAPGEELVRLTLADGAVATSRRLRTRRGAARPGATGGGEPHIVDPRLGAPVVAGLVSATVVMGDAWQADALSTAALVAGPDDAPEFLADRGAAALLVAEDGSTQAVGPLDAYLA